MSCSRTVSTLPAPPLDPVKECACGLSYDRDEWQALRLVGVQHAGALDLELRNCVCGSTISVEREVPVVGTVERERLKRLARVVQSLSADVVRALDRRDDRTACSMALAAVERMSEVHRALKDD